MTVDTVTITNYILVAVLICLSAMFSGLTLGLLGLDKIGLQIVMNGDDPELKVMAAKLAPLRENGNLLLCTLLLGNVAVNAYLSILMAEITSGILGFLLSTILIVIFGEIIPQASCSRYAVQIGARCVPLVKVLILLFYPITKPLSLVLDYMLGEELGTIHTKTELTELLKIHVQHGAMDVETGQISAGAITYQDKMVSEVMTSFENCYLISASDNLNFKKITEIFRSGFSRIPVYEKDRHDIVGILLVKDLIFVDPDDETPVRNFIQIFGRNFHLLWPDDKCGDVLRIFKKGHSHMAIVRDVNNEGDGDPWYEMKGIVTLEDILEEILQDEIMDETDQVYSDENIALGSGAFDYGKLRLLDSGKLEYDQLTKEESLAIGAHFLRNVKAFHDTFLDTLDLTVHGIARQEDLSRSTGVPVEIEGNVQSSSSQSPAAGITTRGAVMINNEGEATTRARSHTGVGTATMDCLLNSCPVIDQVRVAPEDDAKPDPADYLYKRGEPAEYLIMVLTGKLTVLAGKDEFRSEAGPWTVIGADALGVDRTGKPTTESDFRPDFTVFIASDFVRYIKISQTQYKKALRGEFVFKQSIKSKGQLFREQQNQLAKEGETTITSSGNSGEDPFSGTKGVPVSIKKKRTSKEVKPAVSKMSTEVTIPQLPQPSSLDSPTVDLAVNQRTKEDNLPSTNSTNVKRVSYSDTEDVHV